MSSSPKREGWCSTSSTDPGHRTRPSRLPLDLQGRQCGSCSAEVNGSPPHVHDRMDQLEDGDVAPMRAFPIIRTWSPDVSFNFEMEEGPCFARAPPEAGTDATDRHRARPESASAWCFMCQDVCTIVSDHEETKPTTPARFFIRFGRLEMHPLAPRPPNWPRSLASGCATSRSAAGVCRAIRSRQPIIP